MNKPFKRLLRDNFMLICFTFCAAISFYFGRWIGLLGAIVGWWLGGVLWRNQKAILNFGYKKFFRKYAVAIINLLILIPLDVLAYRFGGWSTFTAMTVGWISGMLFWRWRKGSW